jgi:hypothetical protein
LTNTTSTSHRRTAQADLLLREVRPQPVGSAPPSTLDAQDRQPAPRSLLRIAKLQELLAEIRASEQPDERLRNVDSNRSEKDDLRLIGGAE